jgi:hypothetical protein
VSISTITIYDVPSLYPATGKLAAVKLVCAMRIQFPHVGVSVTVTGEDLFLFYNGTKVQCGQLAGVCPQVLSVLSAAFPFVSNLRFHF